MAREELGQYYQPVVTENTIGFHYRGRDNVMRQTLIELDPAPAEIAGQTARWDLSLESLQHVEFNVRVTPMVEGKKRAKTR